MTTASRQRLRIQTPLWAISLGAWVLLIAGASGMNIPVLCTPGSIWAPLSETNFQLTLAMNPPVSLAAGWFVMLIAMMLPLLWGPLQHIRDRSFPILRVKILGLFLIGYSAIWMMAGTALLSLTILFRLAAPISNFPIVVILITAVFWQFSPAKQYCLNRCHALPAMDAFGFMAYVGALKFGIKHGMWCVGSCWSLMLIPLMMYQGHVIAMLIVTFWLLAERLDRAAIPRWQMRFPLKAMRMLVAQASTFSNTIQNRHASVVGLFTQRG